MVSDLCPCACMCVCACVLCVCVLCGGLGYVTEVYGEEWMLVFVDEDDHAFVGGDLLMLSTSTSLC